MSKKSAEEISNYIKSEEWQREKEAYIKEFGKLPSLIELKKAATKKGVTLAKLIGDILHRIVD